MTTKEELLQYVKELVDQKIITKDDLNSVCREVDEHKESKKLNIANILYYIGGGIVFLGISILVFQNWSEFNFLTKVLSTLGASTLAYFIGLLLDKEKRTEALSVAFYLIFALVYPIGLYVVFDNIGFDVSSLGMQSLISFILFSLCLLSYFLLKKNLFVLFSIIFGTYLFFAFTNLLVDGNPYFLDFDFYEYRFLLVGLSYILLGRFFIGKSLSSLSGVLHGFGIIAVLGSTLALGGWDPEQNMFWELVYPFLVFGTLFLSVNFKSKSFLTFGTLFLMAYIFKITSEYFSSGLGWPLALVIAGLSMIGVGYMSISIKNKYL